MGRSDVDDKNLDQDHPDAVDDAMPVHSYGCLDRDDSELRSMESTRLGSSTDRYG